MSVTLRKRVNADGTTTLRLDVLHNGQRWYEALSNLKLAKPTTLLIRESNKDLIRQAEQIRTARAAELEAGNYGMVSDKGKRTLVISWLEEYLKKYTKEDKRVMKAVIAEFTKYLQDEGKSKITFAALTSTLLENFVCQLNAAHKGEGASTYYRRLKKAIRQAYKQKLMRQNILDFVEVKADNNANERDILTLDEIKELIKTPIQSPEVRKAALFCLMTGLAFVDVKALKWKHIDFNENKFKNFTRAKTGVTVNAKLNNTALELIGEAGDKNSHIFTLGSANGCNKTLAAWVKRAKIDKKITWHNLRHSAGTNMVLNGVDVLKVANALAQNNLKYTQRYVKKAKEIANDGAMVLNIDL